MTMTGCRYISDTRSAVNTSAGLSSATRAPSDIMITRSEYAAARLRSCRTVTTQAPSSLSCRAVRRTSS